ncbi:hypothetical protein C900_01328 [Fulvivirga imtechensis AK7]|uniref:Uncharacterized protein n=1 Tax=Fulvivirga imtechensis AK7 TaxID=1237149 RepID=L8JZZ0_9BACT|nr:hypothetical protein C900_01328 [Fulvivirga imtechensis AK7]
MIDNISFPEITSKGIYDVGSMFKLAVGKKINANYFTHPLQPKNLRKVNCEL